MRDYWLELITDPSFMGALLGAVITGLIAFTIMIVQLNIQKKERKIYEYRQFYKYLKPFQLSLDRLLKDFYKIMKKDLTTERDLDYFKINVHNFLEEISNIKDEALPHDTFLQYITIKGVVNTVVEIIEDTEAYGGIEETDITSFKICIKLLESSKADIDRKMNEVEELII